MRITLDCFPGGRSRALSMSYDDGTIHDRRLVEAFDRYGIRGSFHLNAGRLDRKGMLGSSEIKSLFARHEVAGHSMTHPHLTDLPRELVVDEIRSDRMALEKLVGYPVRGFSYPYGSHDPAVVEALASMGIEYARTVDSHGTFRVPDDFLRWPSTCHHKGNLLELAKKFRELGPNCRMSLMYVWGHSYEFNRNNNWEMIEEFCSIIGGDEGIWYAPTIEIVDYLKAVARLRFSAAAGMVLNPSAIPVWVRAEGSPLEIPAGATINLL